MVRRETYTIKIGPMLKKVLEEQLKSIQDATYGICDSSYWEAGEIIAIKINS